MITIDRQYVLVCVYETSQIDLKSLYEPFSEGIKRIIEHPVSWIILLFVLNASKLRLLHAPR